VEILLPCSSSKIAPGKTATNSAAAATAPRRPVVQMPDEYLPPNKILFLQNLPTDVQQEQLLALFGQYPGLAEVRMIPTKKDIAFVEFVDEATSTVAKDALHNYKLDGENKIKVRSQMNHDILGFNAHRHRSHLQGNDLRLRTLKQRLSKHNVGFFWCYDNELRCSRYRDSCILALGSKCKTYSLLKQLPRPIGPTSACINPK
jgi:hypothetical protein